MGEQSAGNSAALAGTPPGVKLAGLLRGRAASWPGIRIRGAVLRRRCGTMPLVGGGVRFCSCP